MDILAGVLFHMDAGETDAFALAVECEIEVPLLGDG